MNFVLQLKRKGTRATLPNFNRLHIIFGEQGNKEDCFQRSIDFVAKVAADVVSLKESDYETYNLNLSRGEAAYIEIETGA